MRILFVSLIIFLSSCTSHDDLIKQGKKLFNTVHIGKNNVIGCISCHSIKPDISTVGPSLYGIALRADKLVKDMPAEDYLRQSIINPDAYIVSGYLPATMFSHYKDELSEQEINQLVAYLTSLYAE
jgi:cytochrome c2